MYVSRCIYVYLAYTILCINISKEPDRCSSLLLADLVVEAGYLVVVVVHGAGRLLPDGGGPQALLHAAGHRQLLDLHLPPLIVVLHHRPHHCVCKVDFSNFDIYIY